MKNKILTILGLSTILAAVAWATPPTDWTNIAWSESYTTNLITIQTEYGPTSRKEVVNERAINPTMLPTTDKATRTVVIYYDGLEQGRYGIQEERVFIEFVPVWTNGVWLGNWNQFVTVTYVQTATPMPPGFVMPSDVPRTATSGYDIPGLTQQVGYTVDVLSNGSYTQVNHCGYRYYSSDTKELSVFGVREGGPGTERFLAGKTVRGYGYIDIFATYGGYFNSRYLVSRFNFQMAAPE